MRWKAAFYTMLDVDGFEFEQKTVPCSSVSFFGRLSKIKDNTIAVDQSFRWTPCRKELCCKKFLKIWLDVLWLWRHCEPIETRFISLTHSLTSHYVSLSLFHSPRPSYYIILDDQIYNMSSLGRLPRPVRHISTWRNVSHVTQSYLFFSSNVFFW